MKFTVVIVRDKEGHLRKVEETFDNNGVLASQYVSRPIPEPKCRVYWGSHGCYKKRGHKGSHVCDCCRHKTHHGKSPGPDYCVGRSPYYGPKTNFYGEDTPKTQGGLK